MRLTLLVTTFAITGIASGQPTDTAPGNSSIQATELEAHVRTLASDDKQCRRTETLGNRKAAAFIATQFARHGLGPIGSDRTYFHRFNLVTTQLGRDNRLGLSGLERPTSNLGTEFYPDPISASGIARGPIVFVGFGIDAPDLGHDDYGRTDLTGAVAMMLAHEPGEFRSDSRFDGQVRSEDARLARKVLAAQKHGAIGVLVAPDIHNHGRPNGLTRPMRSVWPSGPPSRTRYDVAHWVEAITIPVVHVSGQRATDIIALAGQSFDELASAAERTGGGQPTPLVGSDVEISASVQRVLVPNRNVVGLVEGVDPSYRDEWIILSAHYDHEGSSAGRIFRGADDDASGVAGLIEIAEAYQLAAARGVRPRRSILFAAWNSEEQGLLGAWAYTETPLHPLERTVAVLNMDMIGRDEQIPNSGGPRFRGLSPQTAESNRNALNILGYSRSPDLRDAAVRANRASRRELRFRYDDNASNLLRRSDQWPFLYREVPALFLHTGLHPDYHTERDHPDTLHYEKMTRIVQLAHQLSWDLATQDHRPVYVAP